MKKTTARAHKPKTATAQQVARLDALIKKARALDSQMDVLFESARLITGGSYDGHTFDAIYQNQVLTAKQVLRLEGIQVGN